MNTVKERKGLASVDGNCLDNGKQQPVKIVEAMAQELDKG